MYVIMNTTLLLGTNLEIMFSSLDYVSTSIVRYYYNFFFFCKRTCKVKSVCEKNSCISFMYVVTHCMVNVTVTCMSLDLKHLIKDKQNINIIFIFMKLKQILNSEDCDAFNRINIPFVL